MAQATNIGFFGMLNAGYNAVGTAFSVLDRSMNALDNLAAVGELKTKSYLDEERIISEERLEMLQFKQHEARERILAAKAAKQPLLTNVASEEVAA